MRQTGETPVLSPELVELVLTFLPSAEIAQARGVCRAWRAIGLRLLHRRADGPGPFWSVLARDVPLACRLPLFQTTDGHMLAHPAVAGLSEANGLQCVYAAPCVRAKFAAWRHRHHAPPCLQRLPDRTRLPRARVLEIGESDARRLGMQAPGAAFASWPAVHTLILTGNAFHAGTDRLALAFPACTALWLDYFESKRAQNAFARDLAAWPRVDNLVINHLTFPWHALPAGLRALRLHDATMEAPAPARPLPPHGFWPRQAPTQRITTPVVWTDEIHQVLELPLLESLEMPLVALGNVALRTPRLRKLEICSEHFMSLEVAALGALEDLTLYSADRFAHDLAPLRSCPLKRLHLTSIALASVAVLEQFTLLQSLNLHYVAAPPAPMPWHALARLTDLHISATARDMRITNIDELARLPALESLTLRCLPCVTDLRWARRLHALKTVWLIALPKLTSLDGIQGPRGLTDLHLKELRGLSNLAPLGDMPALRNLSIEELPAHSGLNLVRSPVRRVHLSRSDASYLALPVGLRMLTLHDCRNREGHDLRFVRPLTNLRSLDYTSHFTGDIDFAPLEGLQLKMLSVTARTHTRTATLRNVHAQHITVDLFHATPAALAGNTARSLYINASNWRLDDLAACVNPATLQRLHVTMCSELPPPDLGALRACRLLEYLEIACGRLDSIADLAGHPALREVRVFGGFPDRELDIAPLLTCPRLLLAEVSGMHVAPAQQEALHAYLDAQRDVSA